MSKSSVQSTNGQVTQEAAISYDKVNILTRVNTNRRAYIDKYKPLNTKCMQMNSLQ